MPNSDHFRLRARRPVRLSARISAHDGELSLEARVLDLGLEGALVEVPFRLEPGDRVSLRVDLPGLWDPLPLEAVVAWTAAPHPEQRGRAGVRFVATSGRSLRLIAELVATS